MLQVAPIQAAMAPPWCEIEGGKAKVSIQILLYPGQEHSKLRALAMGASIHTRSAELPVKLPYLTVRVPLLKIAPPYCANSNRKVRKEKKVVKSRGRDIASLREARDTRG